MDQSAHGVKRTLKCCGNSSCLRLCPWSLAIRVLSDHASPSETTPLFPDKDGTRIQKVKMVKSWMDNINEELTGHSARRSGAMWYARKGLPVHEIGLLGRWKSSAVFRYIEEALQEIPLNTNVMATTTGAQDRQMICPGTPVPGHQWQMWQSSKRYRKIRNLHHRPEKQRNRHHQNNAGQFPRGAKEEHHTVSDGPPGT